MKILTVLTYYRPYTSGLTIYAERLAKTLVKRGHSVTILTMQYDKNLPIDEVMEGVRVIRAPVLFKISKGAISPSLWNSARKLIAEHDIVHLHLPQFDAAGIGLLCKLLRTPSVITYHCDILLPPGIKNRIINTVITTMDNLAGIFANRIVTYTEDYAQNTPYLKRFLKKLAVILPPVELPAISEIEKENFSKEIHSAGDGPIIGMAARLATEKGVEILLNALPSLLERFPKAKVLFAGQFQNVLGEEVYYNKLMPVISELEKQGRWKFLGILSPSQMSAFFASLNLLVVPSLNSTESFGLVQIEAMMHGVPVVVSDLPGVRQSVKMSSMGKIFPIGDSAKMSDAMISVLSSPGEYTNTPENFFQRFSHNSNAEEYEKLYQSLIA